MPARSQRELLANVLTRYVAAYEGSPAEQYAQNRGLTNSTYWELGYSAAGTGLNEHPTGRLVIPYKTPAGVVDLKFRSLDDSKPKYLYHPGSTARLFNTRALLIEQSPLVVTEGELDAMTVQQVLGLPAVAYPGVSSFKPFMARAFAGLPEVIVVSDGDEPGRDAAKVVADEIRRHAEMVRVAICPDGEDMNSLFVKHGADVLKGLLH